MTPEQLELWERIEANTAELKRTLTLRQANDAVNEADVKGAAEMEQEETAVENTARLVALYYATLRQEGIPKMVAHNLTLDFQGFKLSRYDSDNG